MKPPTGGPRIGPIVAGIISQAMARTSSAFDTARNITSRPTGDIIAPPAPCSMRAATRKDRLGACAQAIDPSVNKPIAERNTVREPKRSAMPAAGRDEHRERQQIGRERHVHVQRVGVEASRHRRQRRGQHGAVELLHEHGAGDDQRDGARAGAGGCGGVRHQPPTSWPRVTRPSTPDSPCADVRLKDRHDVVSVITARWIPRPRLMSGASRMQYCVAQCR